MLTQFLFLELFHKVLKMIHLYHNALIVTLLKVARDKAFDFFRKLKMKKTTQTNYIFKPFFNYMQCKKQNRLLHHKVL